MITSLLFGLLFTVAHAQSSDASILSTYPDLIQEQADVTLDPEIPAPNSSVTITLDSYGNNLDAASIKWTINGKVVQSGTGDKVLKITTGAAGKTSNIVVYFVPSDGPPFSQTITITPENLDLLWQSDGYTPPFYKGKSLFPLQGTVTFVAMPEFVTSNGGSISPKNLIYKWTKNDSVLGDQSGYGKNTLTVTSDEISTSMTVEVDVQSQDGNLQASQAIEVDPSNVQALMYQSDPLYGVLFNKAISNTFNLTGKEISLEAYPYYFSSTNRNNPVLTYNWQMNSTAINVPSSQDNMTFRNTNNSKGNTSVSLDISAADKILQSASTAFTLNFGQTAKDFFGL